MFTIYHYLTQAGKDVFEEWLDALGDVSVQARIAVRINRMAAGNFGD